MPKTQQNKRKQQIEVIFRGSDSAARLFRALGVRDICLTEMESVRRHRFRDIRRYLSERRAHDGMTRYTELSRIYVCLTRTQMACSRCARSDAESNRNGTMTPRRQSKSLISVFGVLLP